MFDSLFPKEWTTLQRLMWLKTNALARAVYETITGNPVSFTAKAAPLRQLEVAFSPVQDLHGYDSPWPAGGGKNICYRDDSRLPASDSGIDVVADGTDGIKISGTASGTIGFNLYKFPVEDGVTYTCSFVGTLVQNQLYINMQCHLNGVYVKNLTGLTENAPVYTFTCDGTYDTVTLRPTINSGYAPQNIVLKFQAEKGSQKSAWAPYSNECPISGWDSLNVEQTGKNLLSNDWITGLLSITVGDDINAVTPSARYCHSAIFQAKSGLAFSITSHDLSKVNFFTVNMYTGNTLAARYTETISEVDTKRTCIVPSNTYDSVRVNIGSPSGVMILDTIGNADIQLELGTTATDYVPYNPLSRSISITLGQTVYSGYVDVVTGVGEVDKILYTYDGSADEDWKDNSPNGVYLQEAKLAGLNRSVIPIANYLTGVSPRSGGRLSSWQLAFNTALTNLLVKGDGVVDATVESWAAYLATNPLTILFGLATPIPIQLTPQEVESLAGDNTMWTDGDSLEVTYRSN